MAGAAVSVAMSVYNGARFLVPAIESILNQTMADFEFLIVNDGSTDDSRAIIDGFVTRDRRIRATHRENRGLIASLNEMVAMARAPLVARMDADDVAEPERLTRQLGFLRAHPDHGVLGSWSSDIDETGARIWLNGPDQPLHHADILVAMQAGRSVLCHPSVMMSRDLVRAVGGYHAAFRHCEDYDLWLRLAHATKIANLPERLLRYRQSPEQITKRFGPTVAYGSAVARFAFELRSQGRVDPTQHLDTLPPVHALDALFGAPGYAKRAQDSVFNDIVYTKDAMKGPEFEQLLDHIRAGGNRSAQWRTVARLAIRMNAPVRAIRLAAALSGVR